MKKKKLSPSKLADKLFKISADAEGISLEEYKKRRAIRKKQQEEYSKTHWVSWLTDAQKHLIATTTVEPFNYMGKPLSRENQLAVKNYIAFHPNYKVFKKNYDKQIPEIILRTLKSLNKEFEGTFLEEVGRDIMFTHMANNKAELSKKLGKPFDDAFEIYKKGMGKKGRDAMATYLKGEKIKKIHNDKVQEAMESVKKVQQEYQEIGRKLRGKLFNTETEQLIKMNKILNPLKLGTNIIPNPFDLSGKKGGGLLEPQIDKSHGLNTLMKKKGMKSVFEIAPHFIKTFEDKTKADWFADSYDNAVALAKATGVTYERLFVIVCKELIKRDKHYKDEALVEKKGIIIEELINIFESKCQSKSSIKYTQKAFFNSKERKAWSAKYGYDWKNYKRFMEQFPEWIRIFKARAFKKGTYKDVDELIEAQKKLRKLN